MTDPISSLRRSIKESIVEGLGLDGVDPESIDDREPLFGEGGLGLDSVDALELVVVLEKQFGISIDGQAIDPEDFSDVASLASMVEELRARQAEAG